MQSSILGHSHWGLPIWAHHFGPTGSSPRGALQKLLIIAATHGDESESVVLAQRLLEDFQDFPHRVDLTLIPALNPDGVLRGSRLNSKGVDLNRNLPTHDWSPEVKNPRYPPGPAAGSEPENQALVRHLDANKPDLILSLHSFTPCLNINGNCRQAAELLSRHTGYKVVEDMGYPTPGCLGTYAGIEREMPTITYEIERGLEPKAVADLHVPAIRELIKFLER